jgi:hypothetical protein
MMHREYESGNQFAPTLIVSLQDLTSVSLMMSERVAINAVLVLVACAFVLAQVPQAQLYPAKFNLHY